MRTSSLLFLPLAAALMAGCTSAVRIADGRFYDPSNRASPTGMTRGYTLYRTIGCPGREMLGTPCVVTEAVTVTPVAPASTKVVTEVTPLPTPIQIAEPVPVPTEQYCAVLDIRFEIDRYEIQREVREQLATVGAFLTRFPDSVALIEGHTDSVGTPEYNMALSLRRAESVVTYLVENHRVAPDRLRAVGYGETRPLADNNSEQGKRMNRRIDAVIACATDIAGLTVLHTRPTLTLKIKFDQNQAEIKPEYGADLARVADSLKTYPQVTATVEGHAGVLQATPEQAMVISLQRAENVVNALVDNHGIPSPQLAAQGFGQTRRIAYGTNLESDQENRRVHIIFNYPN